MRIERNYLCRKEKGGDGKRREGGRRDEESRKA
jgi:hypothetical protein